MSLEVVIFLYGAGTVGKSTLCVRFVAGQFIERYDPTIEDSYRKHCEIDGAAWVLDVMDTAGRFEYRDLISMVKHSNGVLLMYSTTSRTSFEYVHKVRNMVIKTTNDETFPMILVATKKDLVEQREVSEQEGKELAETYRIPFIETSSKTNENVNLVFEEMTRAVTKWRRNNPESRKPKRQPRKQLCIVL